jgi:hypothetical protein
MGQEHWEKNEVSRHKKEEYLVNAIDVAQNIKKSVPLVINFFVNFNAFLKGQHF